MQDLDFGLNTWVAGLNSEQVLGVCCLALAAFSGWVWLRRRITGEPWVSLAIYIEEIDAEEQDRKAREASTERFMAALDERAHERFFPEHHESHGADGDAQASARSQLAPDKARVIPSPGIGAQVADERRADAAAFARASQAGSEPADSLFPQPSLLRRAAITERDRRQRDNVRKCQKVH